MTQLATGAPGSQLPAGVKSNEIVDENQKMTQKISGARGLTLPKGVKSTKSKRCIENEESVDSDSEISFNGRQNEVQSESEDDTIGFYTDIVEVTMRTPPKSKSKKGKGVGGSRKLMEALERTPRTPMFVTPVKTKPREPKLMVTNRPEEPRPIETGRMVILTPNNIDKHFPVLGQEPVRPPTQREKPLLLTTTNYNMQFPPACPPDDTRSDTALNSTKLCNKNQLTRSLSDPVTPSTVNFKMYGSVEASAKAFVTTQEEAKREDRIASTWKLPEELVRKLKPHVLQGNMSIHKGSPGEIILKGLLGAVREEITCEVVKPHNGCKAVLTIDGYAGSAGSQVFRVKCPKCSAKWTLTSECKGGTLAHLIIKKTSLTVDGLETLAKIVNSVETLTKDAICNAIKKERKVTSPSDVGEEKERKATSRSEVGGSATLIQSMQEEISKLKERLSLVESELNRLKQKSTPSPATKCPWGEAPSKVILPTSTKEYTAAVGDVAGMPRDKSTTHPNCNLKKNRVPTQQGGDECGGKSVIHHIQFSLPTKKIKAIYYQNIRRQKVSQVKSYLKDIEANKGVLNVAFFGFTCEILGFEEDIINTEAKLREQGLTTVTFNPEKAAQETIKLSRMGSKTGSKVTETKRDIFETMVNCRKYQLEKSGKMCRTFHKDLILKMQHHEEDKMECSKARRRNLQINKAEGTTAHVQSTKKKDECYVDHWLRKEFPNVYSGGKKVWVKKLGADAQDNPKGGGSSPGGK
jgi:hypothetical protein